jgi:hypothetical protein
MFNAIDVVSEIFTSAQKISAASRDKPTIISSFDLGFPPARRISGVPEMRKAMNSI